MAGVDRGHRHAFVAGLHRSGTSALTAALGASGDASVFRGTGAIEDEGQFLQDVFLDDNHYGGPGRFGFRRGAHLTEADVDLVERGRAALFDAWSPHWALERPVLVEKSPSHILRLRWLQAVFPGARFVIMVRNPIAVSLATARWSRTSLHSLIHHWVRCHELLARDLPFLEHAVVLGYEALAARWDASLPRLADFLGCRQPARVEAWPAFVDTNEPYLEAWRRRLGAPSGAGAGSPVAEGQGALTRRLERSRAAKRVTRAVKAGLLSADRELVSARREAEDAIATFEDRVAAFGYSLVDPRRAPALAIFPGDAWPGAARSGAPA